MKVLFYGQLADVVGRELQLEGSSDCSIAQLRDRIIAGHPNIAGELSNERVRACIGDRLVDDDHLVHATDCVEFLAPVSGG